MYWESYERPDVQINKPGVVKPPQRKCNNMVKKNRFYRSGALGGFDLQNLVSFIVFLSLEHKQVTIFN
jgi:hypothetical protein